MPATKSDLVKQLSKSYPNLLKKDLEKTKLEYDYLSSAEKLLEYQILYFDDELVKKNIDEIKIINKNLDNLEIKPFKISNE